MSQAKRQRRQSIRGAQAGAKKKRRTASRTSGPTLPSLPHDHDFEFDTRLGFLASGAADALRRVARASSTDRTAEDEDEDINDFETEASLLTEYLAGISELLEAPPDPRIKTGDGALLLAAYQREKDRLDGGRFIEGETGLDPFDALDRTGRIELASFDRDRAIETVGLMLARGTDWDPFGPQDTGRPN